MKHRKIITGGIIFVVVALGALAAGMAVWGISYRSVWGRALTPLEQGRVLLLGAEKAAGEAAGLTKRRTNIRVRIRVLEKVVEAREQGWRETALEVSKLNDELTKVTSKLKETRAKEGALLKRGITVFSKELKQIKKPSQIEKHSVDMMLWGKALLKVGENLEAAAVFKRLETGRIPKNKKALALNARITALDREIRNLKLPEAPNPADVKLRPPRKALPDVIGRFHDALEAYIKGRPNESKAAVYAYWIGSHNYLYGRYEESRRWFRWIKKNHCRSSVALEAGTLILQSAILEKGENYAERLLVVVKSLRKTDCWRRRRCKKGDKKCSAWSKKAGAWMLELAEIEEHVEKRIRSQKRQNE